MFDIFIVLLVLLVLFAAFSIGIALVALYVAWRCTYWVWCQLTVRISLLYRLPHEQAAHNASLKLMDEYNVPRWVPFFMARRIIKKIRTEEAAKAKAA